MEFSFYGLKDGGQGWVVRLLLEGRVVVELRINVACGIHDSNSNSLESAAWVSWRPNITQPESHVSCIVRINSIQGLSVRAHNEGGSC